mmetsp:Transcript_53088/g.113488  ORF Transcript_53088/g.113488 Transcript_53088/m.113488 type:complete len:243 (+) Transcript_53088:616-1344(+)
MRSTNSARRAALATFRALLASCSASAPSSPGSRPSAYARQRRNTSLTAPSVVHFSRLGSSWFCVSEALTSRRTWKMTCVMSVGCSSTSSRYCSASSIGDGSDALLHAVPPLPSVALLAPLTAEGRGRAGSARLACRAATSFAFASQSIARSSAVGVRPDSVAAARITRRLSLFSSTTFLSCRRLRLTAAAARANIAGSSRAPSALMTPSAPVDCRVCSKSSALRTLPFVSTGIVRTSLMART